MTDADTAKMRPLADLNRPDDPAAGAIFQPTELGTVENVVSHDAALLAVLALAVLGLIVALCLAIAIR